jgi:4-hydroxy-3-methylbut-2-en-1-yl diphosphate reductase
MNILLAKSAGFCFGVKRATNMAFAAAEGCRNICSLGPIIHSPQVVEKLAAKGVQVVDRVEEIKEQKVIIRSHGITAEELAAISKKSLEIIDATCPFVKKAQQHAAALSREGYHLVLVGEEEHPEVQGIVSFAGDGPVTVVATPVDAERLPRCAKLGVVAQTTQSLGNFQQIVALCLRKSKEVRVFNTICDATSVRQEEAREIAGKVDLMLVIGGYNSANTTRLAVICKELQPNTHHLETADDIDPSWFESIASIGITAGASTPGWLIEQVVKQVEKISRQAKK